MRQWTVDSQGSLGREQQNKTFNSLTCDYIPLIVLPRINPLGTAMRSTDFPVDREVALLATSPCNEICQTTRHNRHNELLPTPNCYRLTIFQPLLYNESITAANRNSWSTLIRPVLMCYCTINSITGWTKKSKPDNFCNNFVY